MFQGTLIELRTIEVQILNNAPCVIDVLVFTDSTGEAIYGDPGVDCITLCEN